MGEQFSGYMFSINQLVIPVTTFDLDPAMYMYMCIQMWIWVNYTDSLTWYVGQFSYTYRYYS